MATSKTLTPTNVTISIPEFTDQPDQRVNSNCIDKEADAINALNGKIDTLHHDVYNWRSYSTIISALTANIATVCPTTGKFYSFACELSGGSPYVCMIMRTGTNGAYINGMYQSYNKAPCGILSSNGGSTWNVYETTVSSNTASGTTTASGNLATTLSPTNVRIISAYTPSGNIVIPFVYSGYWYFHVMNNSAQAQAGVSETVNYQYVSA